MNNRTKIVCTIGPASQDINTLIEMVNAGMNVARLNFSHGDLEAHTSLINNIKEVEKKTGKNIAIMQDLQGPKIRVGILPEEGVRILDNDDIIFDTSTKEYTGDVIPIDYTELHEHIKEGERILLNDGRIEVTVTRVKDTVIEGKVVSGGHLVSHKGINVPDSRLTGRALTEKDKQDVRFGIENEVDFIAISFVSDASDVLDLKYLIRDYEKELDLKPDRPIRLIAKIERRAAVRNIKEIIGVSDGIMVARGDLGIEIAAADVPLTQKRLIDMSMEEAKPVIVATQMLDSMRLSKRPTRAEVSDVANAVIDHTDAVMLSGETAIGQYPVESVKMMSEIINQAEKSVYDNMEVRQYRGKNVEVDDIISQMSRLLAERVNAKLILAASNSGETGRLISRYRPELPIVVATPSPRVRNQLNLSWGVVPFILKPSRTIEELIDRSIAYLKKNGKVVPGDDIIVVAGEPIGQAGHVNLLEVREVK